MVCAFSRWADAFGAGSDAERAIASPRITRDIMIFWGPQYP